MKTLPDSNRSPWHGIMTAYRTLIVLAVAVMLGGLAGPGDAEASQSGCTKEWLGGSTWAGNWHDGFNWTGGTAPTASDHVCVDGVSVITLVGSRQAASLRIGPSSHLRLAANCSSDAMLVVTGSVYVDEDRNTAIYLVNGCPDAPRDVTLEVRGEIVNDGRIEVGRCCGSDNGGGRYLRGEIDNRGEVIVYAGDLHFQGGDWHNQGALQIENGASLSAELGEDHTFFTFSGAPIGGEGVLSVSGGRFWYQGGMTAGAGPIELNDSTFELDTINPAEFLVQGSSSLYGDVASGQSIHILGDCTKGSASLSMSDSSTNRGTLELASADCAADARVYVAPGRTLTNAGTITVSEGAGGGRFVSGDVVNTGAVVLGHDLSFDWNGASWLNQGSLTIGDGATLSLLGSQTSFTNAAGGSIAGQGTGRVSVSGGTFVHGDGTFSGPEPIHLGGSELTITGTTPASYLWQGSGRLTGDVAHGQSIRLLGGCGQPAELRQAGFTNRGTIELTSQARCAGDALINVFGGKLTNLGTLRVLAGAGGARSVAGLLQNQGLLELGAGTTLQTVGYEETAQATFATSVNSASSVGVLSSSARATLAGTLATARAAPFNPPVGTTIPILNASAVSGAWTSVTGAVIAGSVYFRPTYSPLDASLVVRDAWLSPWPTSGPPGSSVTVRAKHFPANTKVTLGFTDSAGTSRTVGIRMTDGSGSLSTAITVPAAAALGNGRLTATSSLTVVTAAASFHVT